MNYTISQELFDRQDDETQAALLAAGAVIVQAGSPTQVDVDSSEAQGSEGELLFSLQIEQAGLPEPLREYRFHSERKWRADFAWPREKILIEIEGGTWGYGRHNRPAGFAADIEKYNEATKLGWRVYRFTTEMVQSGDAIAFIKGEL